MQDYPVHPLIPRILIQTVYATKLPSDMWPDNHMKVDKWDLTTFGKLSNFKLGRNGNEIEVNWFGNFFGSCQILSGAYDKGDLPTFEKLANRRDLNSTIRDLRILGHIPTGLLQG